MTTIVVFVLLIIPTTTSSPITAIDDFPTMEACTRFVTNVAQSNRRATNYLRNQQLVCQGRLKVIK